MTFAGQRPTQSRPPPAALPDSPIAAMIDVAVAPLLFAEGLKRGSEPIRQAPILRAPACHASRFAPTDFARSGLRATMIGSCAGLSVVDQSSHRAASSVAGAVMFTRVAWLESPT